MIPLAIIVVWIFIFVQVAAMIEILANSEQYTKTEKLIKIIVLIISIIILIILC